ncbi:unnamed protein product [Gongylonema pulchrum]|uniref:Uncharacterized protein n=1 Tax=Gongylonema pulchrum TaxID=637853 RepID=A0A3P7NQL1_9BILA|nr:unnamed protein product [Gongylonema pulchrum]
MFLIELSLAISYPYAKLLHNRYHRKLFIFSSVILITLLATWQQRMLCGYLFGDEPDGYPPIYNGGNCKPPIAVQQYYDFSERVADQQPYPYPCQLSAEQRDRALTTNIYLFETLSYDPPAKYIADPLIKKHFRDNRTNVTYSAQSTGFYKDCLIRLPTILYVFTNLMCEKSYLHGSGKTTVALVGNSFANRAAPSLLAALGDSFKEMRYISQHGCNWYYGSEFPGNICSKVLNATLALLEEARPDVIFYVVL